MYIKKTVKDAFIMRNTVYIPFDSLYRPAILNKRPKKKRESRTVPYIYQVSSLDYSHDYIIRIIVHVDI